MATRYIHSLGELPVVEAAQPTVHELRQDIDVWRSIVEIRSKLFNDVGGLTILAYRFGQARSIPVNAPEAGYEKQAYDVSRTRNRLTDIK